MARKIISALNDTTMFLQEWFTNPQRIGAVAPSSRLLANAMARWLPADRKSYVLELGPGTGAVTKALLKHGLAPERLIAIEKNPKMAELLRRRYPRTHVIEGDACHVKELLREHLGVVPSVGAVISSLPLRVFPADVALLIVQQIRAVLQPGGKWVQYTYYLGGKPPRGATEFDLLKSSVVWLNIPPARVNVYQK